MKPIDFSGGLLLLVYGRSATGKTTFWASFPGKTLVIICSNTSRPGELRSIATPENIKRMKQVVLTKTEDLPELMAWAADQQFDNVVLDHASGLQDLRLMEILGLDEVPVQKSWSMASREEFGQCAADVKVLLKGMLCLECNVIIVAHERSFNDDNDSDVILPTVGAALSPSVTGWLNGAVDYITETFLRAKWETVEKKVGGKVKKKKILTDEVEYCMRIGPDAVFTTKFRRPKGAKKLPKVIVDPTYEKVMALIEGRELPKPGKA